MHHSRKYVWCAYLQKIEMKIVVNKARTDKRDYNSTKLRWGKGGYILDPFGILGSRKVVIE